MRKTKVPRSSFANLLRSVHSSGSQPFRQAEDAQTSSVQYWMSDLSLHAGPKNPFQNGRLFLRCPLLVGVKWKAKRKPSPFLGHSPQERHAQILSFTKAGQPRVWQLLLCLLSHLCNLVLQSPLPVANGKHDDGKRVEAPRRPLYMEPSLKGPWELPCWFGRVNCQ